MKKVKKIVAFVLAAALSVTAFTACGGGNSSVKKGMEGRTEIKIGYWLSGLGEQWLKDVIVAFEESQDEYFVTYTTSPSSGSLVSAFGMADMDQVDIYMCIKNEATEYMEPLDDILEATAEGDSKPLKEKFNRNYLAYEEAADGKHYTLTYGGGMTNMYYNKDLFESAGVKQLPRTTEELTILCDTFSSQGIVPLCHFKNGGYYEFMLRLYMAQYDGMDYYLNHWFTCTDEAGNSPSKAVLTKKDGRYYALKAMERFITPNYALTGSTTQSHTEIQTQFLNGSAAMMLNGSWIENEMKIGKDEYNLGAMKVPVLSAIVNTLETVKTESALRAVVAAVDQITAGEKTAADFVEGDGYAVEGNIVSKGDWQRIMDARNMIQSNYAESSCFIPNYSAEKEGAKKFLQFMYSDKGYKIVASTTKCPMPMALSTGEAIDTSEMSETQAMQFELCNMDALFVDSGSSKEHAIFLTGGASLMASIKYVDKFSAGNADDRMTADEVWNLMVKTVDENYENNWLLNIGAK